MFNINKIKILYEQYGCPIWVYKWENIIESINKLIMFDVIRFAQKACCNINILCLMHRHGLKVDSVSLGEIERALVAGYSPWSEKEDIIFTSDILDKAMLARILELGIKLNAGSADMLALLGSHSPGHGVWLRINPGFGKGHSKKTNTGGENSKHGIWYKDLGIALTYIKKYNLKILGIHIHIGSGIYNKKIFNVCDALVQNMLASRKKLIAISAGGGLCVPYKEGEEYIDTYNYFIQLDIARHRISKYIGHSLKVEIEPGRFLVGEAGMLVSQVIAVKNMGRQNYVIVDAGFNDLMRPCMYGSYHKISFFNLFKKNISTGCANIVFGGPLCESGDVFTKNKFGNIEPRRMLPAQVGDYILFHNTGAYGASMSSNYNSRTLLPEVLYIKENTIYIRSSQYINELFILEPFICL